MKKHISFELIFQFCIVLINFLTFHHKPCTDHLLSRTQQKTNPFVVAPHKPNNYLNRQPSRNTFPVTHNENFNQKGASSAYNTHPQINVDKNRHSSECAFKLISKIISVVSGPLVKD